MGAETAGLPPACRGDRARDRRRASSAVAIHSHEGAPFRHSLILPIFVENEPRPTGHYTVR